MNHIEEGVAITEKENEKKEPIAGVPQVSYCPKCGGEIGPETKFCSKCGTAVSVAAQPSTTKPAERRAPEAPAILGFVSAGVILIVLAAAYIRHPIAPSVIVDYFQMMADQGIFIKPPLVLFDPAIFFFYAIGIWGIILSALRIVLERKPREALGDLVGGLLSFYIAFLLTNYAADIFTARATLAYLIVGIGLFVILTAVIQYAFRERR